MVSFSCKLRYFGLIADLRALLGKLRHDQSLHELCRINS